MEAEAPRPGTPVRGSESGRPVMAVLDLLGRRWTMRILWELSQAPAGFRELQRRCERMSSSVLSTRLGELADARLATAHDAGYRLTRLGEDLVEALGPLNAWSRRWAEEVSSDTRAPSSEKANGLPR
jgi:DNA-binding HxlR family transcriptional regulator